MNTPDVLFYIHPEMSADGRNKVEQELMTCKGVLAANFDHHEHPHMLDVLYDSDMTDSSQLLTMVRKFDPSATMIGL